MKNIVSSAVVLFLLSLSFSSQAQTKNYEFFSPFSGGPFQFPGLFLDGQVSGKLKLTRLVPGPFTPPSASEFKIDLLSFDFENAPDITATNFSFNPNTNSYIATLSNTWVFRKVNVEVINIDPFTNQFSYRITVVTNEDFTGSTIPGPFPNDLILSEGIADLVDKTPFKIVDVESKTIDGKRLILKLNGNLGSNIDPSLGMIGEGIEIKLLWFGRGEKLAYIPVPPGLNIKPLGFVFQSFNNGTTTEYEFSVRYDDNGAILETPLQPLQFLLDDVYPPIF